VTAASPTLLFVYNADGKLASLLVDAVHKVVSPRTYNCNLCQLTYGLARQKPAWKRFLTSLPVAAEFLHRDEFCARLPGLASEPLPAVFVEGPDGDVHPLVSADELNAIHDLDTLRSLLSNRVASLT
jgi:hypothetical protein